MGVGRVNDAVDGPLSHAGGQRLVDALLRRLDLETAGNDRFRIVGGHEPIYGFFRARDASTGSPLFTFQVGGPIGSGPVIADGMVFVGVGVRVAPATPEADGVFAFAP